jgi:hypothetical protein
VNRLTAVLLVTGMLGAFGAGAVFGQTGGNHFFYNATQLYDKDSTLQNGYVAGVFDAISVLDNNGVNSQQLHTMYVCLDSKADRLIPTREWVMSAIQDDNRPKVPAAQAMMEACNVKF